MALCGEPKPSSPSPTPTNETCVLELGHDGAHQDRKGEWWGGPPD